MPAEKPDSKQDQIAALRKEIDDASLEIDKGQKMITAAKVKISANTQKIRELSK